MAARNASGSSIYVRPSRTLDAHPWLLIDDLTAAALDSLRECHPPGLVVETSPGSFQAWIRVQEPVPVAARTSIARTLAEIYAGDPGAVGAHQFGRMPGTTNRKPSRRLPDGRSPFAALRHAGDEIATIEIRENDTAPTTRTAAVTTGEKRYDDALRDQSRVDFAIACRLGDAFRGCHCAGMNVRLLHWRKAQTPRTCIYGVGSVGGGRASVSALYTARSTLKRRGLLTEPSPSAPTFVPREPPS